MQTHLGAHSFEGFHLEVCRSHPSLNRTERMLHRFTSHSHLLWIANKSGLRRIENCFMFPTRNTPLLAGRTF